MRLVSGSEKVGLQICGVFGEYKDLQYITHLMEFVARLRVQGVQRCQGKASKDQVSTLKTFHKRPQRP